MEEVIKRLTDALLKVASNKGAPGPGGQTIEALVEQWPAVLPRLQADLLAGTYRPGEIRRQPIDNGLYPLVSLAGTYRPGEIRRAYIPKAGGGQRGLRIPNHGGLPASM